MSSLLEYASEVSCVGHSAPTAPYLRIGDRVAGPTKEEVMQARIGDIAGKGWGILPLRVMIGFGFAAHGYAKLSRGPDNFATILQALGIPQPHLAAWVTSLLELAGGICVMAGAFIVPLSVPLVFVMLTAMFGVHLQYGFSSIRLKAVTAAGVQFGPVGYEINLLYIAGLVTLALFGAGRLSVDRLLSARGQKSRH
jgi:putative oxidoreductase